MIIAGYTRKSILTDSGDSIENQKKMISEYVSRIHPSADIFFYSDEGFTGSNTDRPAFQSLMADVTSGKINILVCYRLDRISRTVSDFSETFELLQKNSVDFISVREQLDTTTPIGRAMMYICSVFAQMERETIAERIRDSSMSLAKAGKWAGGRPPTGFIRERRTNPSGKAYTILAPDANSTSFVHDLFQGILDGNSLSSLETSFRSSGKRSPAGKYISTTTIHQIITNPIYTACSPEVWDYYHQLGCEMVVPRDQFDASSGAIAYNRTTGSRQKKHQNNDMSKWIITKGLHEPIIAPDLFLSVQKRLGVNRICKTRKYDVGLLRGILRCSCGRLMAAKRKVCYDSSNHTVLWNYVCTGRAQRGSDHDCQVKQVNLHMIDQIVLDALTDISMDPSSIRKYTRRVSDPKENLSSLRKQFQANRTKIQNLVSRLEEAGESSASKYIISSIEDLDRKGRDLQKLISEVESRTQIQHKQESREQWLSSYISSEMKDFDRLSFDDKQNFLRNVISSCIWDGSSLTIHMI
ncbi:MAG: recombinase family protein [Oscillospiraceae bacterium]|nr:recombinase family protein [Oscillospiraceae bacterium]